MRTVFYSFFFNFSFQMLSRTVCLFLSLSFSVQPHTSMRGHVCLSVYRSVDWSVGQANVEPAQKCRFQSPCNLITRRFLSHFLSGPVGPAPQNFSEPDKETAGPVLYYPNLKIRKFLIQYDFFSNETKDDDINPKRIDIIKF